LSGLYYINFEKGVRELLNNKRAQQLKRFFKSRLNRKLTIKELKYIRWLANIEEKNKSKN
jgi:hypothetical protein